MRPSAAPQIPTATEDARAGRLLSIAALTYLALVLIMWLPFNPCGGMPYESHFLFNSEVWPFTGFLFPSDPMRPHTSTFYHLSFVLGEALRIGGSFVPFQIVYAALWWARGLLVFLILRRLFPAESVFAFCCGALTIVHASDHALLWVGQLNQFGFIFWMLLAFYLFVLAIQSGSESQTRWYMAGAAAAQHMSLWSYESQLLLILFAPLALLYAGREQLIAKPRIAAAWYVLPAAYIFLSAYGYFGNAAGGYQAGVLRTNWSLVSMASDLWFNINSSLSFWRWAENMPWTLAPEWPTRFGLLAATVYLGGWAGTVALRRPSHESALGTKAWLGMLLAGVAALLMSFPAYLLLGSAADLWRTQFLSGIGAALVWASLAGLAASLLPRRWPRAWVFLALGALVTNSGVAGALRYGQFHDQMWSRHRQAFEALLTVAPRLPERTVVVAVNVPKARDPFGHNMWFNFGLKLAYPGSRVSGIYFFDDGTAAEGNHLHLESAEWVWDQSFESPGYERREVSHTVVVEYDAVQNARIVDHLPALLSPREQAQSRYEPLAVVGPGPASPRAVRRYFPCPDWWWTLSPKPD
jgi:hypothetical protein